MPFEPGSRISSPVPHHSRIAGNWGSAICRIVGANAKLRDEFAEEVRMWVFEEEVEGRKLTEIINTDHENVKYLPGGGIFASGPLRKKSF